MKPLEILLNRMYLKGHHVAIQDHLRNSIHHITYEVDSGFAKVTVDAQIAIPTVAVTEVQLKAINGCIDSMGLLSLMYLTGLGIPRNVIRALTWSKFAVMESADITYEAAIAELKLDRKKMARYINGDLVLPSSFDVLEEQVQQAMVSRPYRKPVEKAWITPIVTGMQVALVYKQRKFKPPVLYCIMDREDSTVTVNSNLHKLFNVPESFGEIRGARTITTYTGAEAEYFVVMGFITTPTSMIAARKLEYPDDNVKTLVNKIVTGQLVDMTLDQAIKFTEDRMGAMIKRHQASLQGKTVNNNKLANMRRVLADKNKVKERALTVIATRSVSRYLKFIATDYCLMDKGKLYDTKIPNIPVHLQSLGFIAMTHPAMESVNYSTRMFEFKTETDISNVMTILKKSNNDLTVTGFQIRPRGTRYRKPTYLRPTKR